MGPLLAKTQLTPATQSEDRHVCIAYLYDYEDGSGLNEEHQHYGWWPRVQFSPSKNWGQRVGMFQPGIYKHPQSIALDNTYLWCIHT